MKQMAMFVAAMMVGCSENEIHSQNVSGCDGKTDDAIVSTPFNPPTDDAGFGGEGGGGFGVGGGLVDVGGAGGGSPLRADGASCDEDSQCENSYCIPSMNSFGIGVCFSQSMFGCILVTEPSPFAASCKPPLKSLFVCGDYDVSLLGTCNVIGTGTIGEDYYCCDKL